MPGPWSLVPKSIRSLQPNPYSPCLFSEKYAARRHRARIAMFIPLHLLFIRPADHRSNKSCLFPAGVATYGIERTHHMPASLSNLREPDRLVEQSDPESFIHLLSQTIVALEHDYVQPTCKWTPLIEGRDVSSSNVDRRSVRDIIDQAILSIFNASPNGRPSNQLTNGFTSSEFAFSKSKSQLPWNPNRPGIYAKQVNTNLQLFETVSWTLLLTRIGPNLLHHVLSKTSLFIPLPNQCLSQLTGTPITDLKPKPPLISSGQGRESRKRKAESDPYWTSDELLSNRSKRSRKGKIRTRQNTEKGQEPCRSTRKHSHMNTDTVLDSAPVIKDCLLDDNGMLDLNIASALQNPYPEPIDKGSKLLKKIKKKKSTSKTRVSPADIALQRSWIFYGRPARRTGRIEPQKRIVVGFPSNHILGSLPIVPSDRPFPSAVLQLILMHIFPSQFALSSRFFEPSARPPGAPPPEHVHLSIEIERTKAAKGGRFKTPEGRMKGDQLKKLTESLARQAGSMDFWKWRSICCPSKIRIHSPGNQNKKTTDDRKLYRLPLEFAPQTPQVHSVSSSVPTEPLSSLSRGSERSVELMTQQIPIPFSSVDHDRDGMSFGVLELINGQEKKDIVRFQEFTQPVGQVCRFATGVIKRVIPIDFFGGPFNQHLVLQSVDKFIRLRRYETMTLHTVLQGFSILECGWLEPGNFVRGSRVSEGDARKRKELAAEFLLWLFEGFLIPLLRTCFYITESTAYKKEVVYFRQDDWEALCRPVYQRLRSTAYQIVEPDGITRTYTGECRKLGHSYVRLLPKENGVRPIINLRRRPKPPKPDLETGKIPWDWQSKSVNGALKETFNIFAHRKDSGPSLFGASILGADDIYPKIVDFKRRVTQHGAELPRFYFVKVDVRSCFDTIDQDTLMCVLNDIFEDDEDYEILRYNTIKLSGGRIKKRFMQQAFPEMDAPTFKQLADTLALKSRREIFVDKAYGTTHTKDQALSLLREHITDNLIKIGPRYFRQTQGIPQGSIVSTHLCSFFYADMERKHLGFTSDPDCMLVRLVDDFLLISTNKSKAIQFVRAMHAGHPRYGCFVSKEKTLVNFECRIQGDLDGPNVTLSTDFPWCGRFISTTSLEIKGDYTRDRTHIKKSLTVNALRNPGLTIRAKVLRNVAQKSPIVFNDCTFNALDTVYLNVYQNLVHCAMKTMNYVKELGFNEQIHSSFLLKIVEEAGEFAFNTINNAARKPVAVAHQARVDIDPIVVSWLGKHAFWQVLSRKPTLFRRMLSSLEHDVIGLKTVTGERLVDVCGKVTSLGWSGMKMIKF
ncbi:telomerase reverse transcriptase [Phaffia rhodozyma]|uniref:Telomerase reverse transcriptase n=1 Tax=Phaffia rhodozyma TaxID=264483 RepID=A0A0F7SL01_PHARH|nr:telomerase reverse transcriptase [Phaffia rhodozyma]